MNARPDAWLRQAQNDLELAQLARDNGYLAQACFDASQAAEKGLKSALLELGLEPPHTHVLNALTRRLKKTGLDQGLRGPISAQPQPDGDPIPLPRGFDTSFRAVRPRGNRSSPNNGP